jgi:predicted GH43/DUF377 family glycosyl hydrolase
MLSAIVLVSTGCATDTPDASSTAGSSSPGTAPAPVSVAPTSTAESTASAVAPSLSFAFDPGPVVTRELAGVDERYINPGAIIDHDGTLHMFANLFTAWPGPVSIIHLRSDDGVTWLLAESGPVLTRDDVPFAITGIDVSTGFVDAEGQWVLVFETVENSKPWVIGRATGPGPDGPWAVDPEPILEPGATGDWDAGGLSWPSVVATEEGYAMYYTGLDRPRGTGAIGLATSADGETWTKHPGPVLAAEVEWERGKVDRPRVARTLDGFVMVYAGGQLTDRGLARSDDGVTWRRDGETPVIEQDDFPSEGRAWDAVLLERDDQLWYFLEIGGATGTAGTQVYLARASIP